MATRRRQEGGLVNLTAPNPWPTSLPQTVCVGEGRTAVQVVLRAQGRDLILCVTGGDAHVGAVAVRSPGGGTSGEGLSALTVVPGHKEGPLAEQSAARVASVTGCTCVAIVGIHQDGATRQEIEAIVRHAERGCEMLLAPWSAAGQEHCTGKERE